MINAYEIARQLGLKYEGRDKKGYWFCYKGRKWNYQGMEFDNAKELAANTVLELFQGTNYEETKNKVAHIKLHISELESSLRNIQENCDHPQRYLNKENKSNTGNYDPSEDSYWSEYHCEACDKRWSGEQNERRGKNE